MNYTSLLTFSNTAEREEYFRTMYPKRIGELAVSMLIDSGFLTAPASSRFHGNYEGGLFDHSVNVANILNVLTERNNLVWKEESADRSPWIVGIAHDLCKIDQYRPILDENGDPIPNKYEYSSIPLIKGHGIKSVIYALRNNIRISQEEMACILYHMGAFTEAREWSDYTAAVKKYPNVLWTHTADMIVSQIMEV